MPVLLAMTGIRQKRGDLMQQILPASLIIVCFCEVSRITAMPIYAYRCASCGHEGEHMQKIADQPLTDCPACNADSYQKQITAAGFQLKGSGWYATDFKGGSAPKSDNLPPCAQTGVCGCQ